MMSPSDNSPGLINIWMRLMKLRVIVLLQITAICAILMHDLLARKGAIVSVDRGWIDTLQTSIWVIIGGTLSAGGANSINMWYDKDIDPGMNRTSKRPIPAGDVSPVHALVFGIVISIIGVAVLWNVHWKAGFWSAFSVLFYVLVYTMWLKRRTPQNIVIGGASGALPPMIGWATVTNDISIGSLTLFAIIFMWTPPHFWALSLYRSGDYAKAGVPMMPVVSGVGETKRQILIYTLLLLPITLVPLLIGMVSIAGGFVISVLGIWFIRHAFLVLKSDGTREPRAMFRYSILYLFLIFSIILIDSLL